MPDFIDERAKWNQYYDSLPLGEENESDYLLSQELVDAIAKLLPNGGRILEAGCGGGWQTLALARTGRYKVAVMDFAPKALEHTRRLFERAGVAAEYLLDDASDRGQPEFDLVFNAGVLEHYDLSQQARLLRGMASRSKKFVMALVPNSLCYWYWLWRTHHAARGGWPFGKEIPQANLKLSFDSAGLDFIGHQYIGATWTESFIQSLSGMDAELKDEVLRIHRSHLIAASQRSYLVAALGSVEPGVHEPEWNRDTQAAEQNGDLAAALCDALALSISAGNRVQLLERSLEHASSESQRLRGEVHAGRIQNLKLDQSMEQLKAQAKQLTQQTEIHTRTIRAAETLRSRTAFGVREYQRLLSAEFDQLAEQRAWKLMLAVRKAYTLLRRRGVAGAAAFFEWSLMWPFTKTSDLRTYSPVLPQLTSYLPENLDESIFGGVAALPAGSAPRNANPLPPDARAQTSYDIVILAIIDFDFRFQRPQQIAAQFAREGHRVFWISPTRYLPASSPEPYQSSQLRENLFEIRLRGDSLDIYMGSLQDSAATMLADSLACLYRDFAIAESSVLVQLPFWRRLGLLLREQHGSKLIYDCMDDWDTFLNMGKFNVSEETSLVRECDLLVVTAQKLADKFTALRLKPLLARNGADFNFFQTAKSNSLLAGIPHPVIGYFGAIADWIDLDLVAQVAQLRPSYSFVLVGQVFDRDVTQLKALPNVFLLGNQEYRHIPSFLLGFDACIIPFLLNQVTQATDPVKLYEYFTLGKPVVATDMAELRQCHDLLYIGHDAADFASKLDLALSEPDSSKVERRIAFASENSWAERVTKIDLAVRERFPLVSIVMVTYNSIEFIEACLKSIQRNTSYPNYELILVDNYSEDGTVEALKAFASQEPRARLILLDSNSGFASANNTGVEAARGEYFILLNADTLVTSGWVGRLLNRVRWDPSIGLVSAVTNYAGNEVKITVDYQNREEMEAFALTLAREKAGEDLDIAMAPLFCGLIPRTIWNAAGPLDVRFEIGMFEDDDFSQSLRSAGYRIVAAEDCFIHHFGQGSFRKLASAAYNKLFDDNQRRFESKWNTQWRAHKTRANVRPSHEEARYDPKTFDRR